MPGRTLGGIDRGTAVVFSIAFPFTDGLQAVGQGQNSSVTEGIIADVLYALTEIDVLQLTAIEKGVAVNAFYAGRDHNTAELIFLSVVAVIVKMRHCIAGNSGNRVALHLFGDIKDAFSKGDYAHQSGLSVLDPVGEAVLLNLLDAADRAVVGDLMPPEQCILIGNRIALAHKRCNAIKAVGTDFCYAVGNGNLVIGKGQRPASEPLKRLRQIVRKIVHIIKDVISDGSHGHTVDLIGNICNTLGIAGVAGNGDLTVFYGVGEGEIRILRTDAGDKDQTEQKNDKKRKKAAFHGASFSIIQNDFVVSWVIAG